MTSLYRRTWNSICNAARLAVRSTLAQIEGFAGAYGAGYEAGKLNRLTRGRNGAPITENTIPFDQLRRLRWASWDVFRNNPYARKVVKSLQAKVIGNGLNPQSMATRPDGTPHVEFRERAAALWKALALCVDARGRPGRGGQSLVGLQKTALSCSILSGDVLTQGVTVTRQQKRRLGLPIPFQIRLVDGERLAYDVAEGDIPAGNQFYRGIELNAEDQRVAYWIADRNLGRTALPGGPPPTWASSAIALSGGDLTNSVKRVDAAQIWHLYNADDIDQLRGVPWFAAALLQLRDTGDYQYNELKASALAACIALGYRRPTGAGSRTPFISGPENWDLVDADGNAIKAMQPGMLIDLGKDGSLEGFNPSRGVGDAVGFIGHLVRGCAAALPGLKGSTVTGDYKGASFSSERAADNDIWPELEGVQEWFASSWCQPMFEEVLDLAVIDGWFDGIITANEYWARRGDFIATTWQGPVCRSINPVDDAQAARIRVSTGASSPQKEAIKAGGNLQDNLRDDAEFLKQAEALGLPKEFIDSVLGLAETLTGNVVVPVEPDPGTETEAKDGKQAKQSPASGQGQNGTSAKGGGGGKPARFALPGSVAA